MLHLCFVYYQVLAPHSQFLVPGVIKIEDYFETLILTQNQPRIFPGPFGRREAPEREALMLRGRDVGQNPSGNKKFSVPRAGGRHGLPRTILNFEILDWEKYAISKFPTPGSQIMTKQQRIQHDLKQLWLFQSVLQHRNQQLQHTNQIGMRPSTGTQIVC